MLVKEFEEDFVSKYLGKDKAIVLARSSKSASQHEVSRSTLISREYRSKLKLGIGYDTVLCSHNAGNNKGKIKLVFKENDKMMK